MYPSGRITLQNRRFIREYTTIQPPSNHIIPSGPIIKAHSESMIQHSMQNPISNQTQEQVSNNTPPAEQTQIESETPTSNNDLPLNSVRKIPRALRNLEDFNKPGLKEALGERR